MFRKILVALDHSKADSFLLPRVKELAHLTGAEIVLLHVSTGWAARWQENLNLSDSQEMKEDREYLEKVRQEVGHDNLHVTARHDSGEPARAILKAADADLIHGATITKVRHESEIPLFIVRAQMD
jgi:nucleotide-binding universal stress UspA family protein